MKSRSWNLFALPLILSLIFLVGCQPAAQPAAPTAAPVAPTAVPAAPTEPPAAPTEPPAAPTELPAVQHKVATFIWTQEFDTLNPYYTNMWFSAITQQLWNCWAWDFDDQNAPHPVLLKEMPSEANGGISPDGKMITMKLRDDIVWSDGTPITSEDFIFTHDMVMDPNVPIDVIKARFSH